jgi:hypothetical protein
VSAATSIAVNTIGRGLKDLNVEGGLLAGRVRRAGGGASRWSPATLACLRNLMALVEPGERGDPVSPLRWTCKSL